jgi:hypothetical protein
LWSSPYCGEIGEPLLDEEPSGESFGDGKSGVALREPKKVIVNFQFYFGKNLVFVLRGFFPLHKCQTQLFVSSCEYLIVIEIIHESYLVKCDDACYASMCQTLRR